MQRLHIDNGPSPAGGGGGPHIILAQEPQSQSAAAPGAGESPQATTATEGRAACRN